MHPIGKFVNFNRCFVLRLQHAKTKSKDYLKEIKPCKQGNKHGRLEKKPSEKQEVQTSTKILQEPTPIVEFFKQETKMEHAQQGDISGPMHLIDDTSFPNLCKNESFVHRNFAEVKTSTLKKEGKKVDRTFNSSDEYHQKIFTSSKNSIDVIPRDNRIRKGIVRNNSYKQACDNNSITEVRVEKKKCKSVKVRKGKKSRDQNININVTCNIKLPQQICHKQTKMVSTEVQTDYIHFENLSSTPLVNNFNNSIEEWSMEKFIKPNNVMNASDAFGLENKNHLCHIEYLEKKIKKKLSGLKKLISDYK